VSFFYCSRLRLSQIEGNLRQIGDVWIQNRSGSVLSILPFFIAPGEVALYNENKAKVLAYEDYNGKTIKLHSPEGIMKQSSGKTL